MDEQYPFQHRRRRLTYAESAAYISGRYFPVQARSLERWHDLPGIVVNKQRLHRMDDLDAAAERRIQQAQAKAGITPRVEETETATAAA
jgi:hypothetical protein